MSKVRKLTLKFSLGGCEVFSKFEVLTKFIHTTTKLQRGNSKELRMKFKEKKKFTRAAKSTFY